MSMRSPTMSMRSPSMSHPAYHVDGWTKFVTIASGLIICAAYIMMAFAFILAPTFAGPLSAVSTVGSILITMCLSIIFFAERLSVRQLVSIGAICIGLTIILRSTQTGGSHDDKSG